MFKTINPNLDEGQTGDPKALQLADTRAIIRKKIEGPDGSPSWTKARDMGQTMVPTMAAATIVRFATGETVKPSAWTIKKLSQEADFKLMLVPAGAIAPPGSFEI